MPNTPPRRMPKPVAPSDVIDYTETPDLKPPPVRKPRTTVKDVPVGKIISSTLESRIAGTLSKATSMSMLNTVGENMAMDAREAFNIWHPITRMVGRRVPDVALKTNLSKPDADDLEHIIITIIEYIARIVDGAFTRAYNKRVDRIVSNQQRIQQTQPREIPQKEMPQAEIETALEEFEDITPASDPGIAPMKNGGGSITELIERGYIPTDMGEMVS